MKKIYISFCLFLILLSSFAFANINDKAVAIYLLKNSYMNGNNLTPAIGNRDLVVSGVVINETSPLGYAFGFNGNGNNILNSSIRNMPISYSTEWTFCLRYLYNSSDLMRIFSSQGGIAPSLNNANPNKIDFLMSDGNAWDRNYQMSATFSMNTWRLDCVVKYSATTGGFNFFLNGTNSTPGAISPNSASGIDTSFPDAVGLLGFWTLGSNEYGQNFKGKISELCMWNRSLTNSEITQITQGSCYQPTSTDTTAPIISNINKFPINYTFEYFFNLTEINATITDETSLNNASINLTLSHNHTITFINGSIYNNNETITYFTAKGNEFSFFLDEQDILSGTFNLIPELMENSTHNYITLKNNEWLKMQFINVSNQKQLTFYEIMADNSTGTQVLSDYYICNANYTTGNPSTSQWCSIFASANNKDNYNHIHYGGNSKHKVFTIGIDSYTGKVGNVYITPTIYILKKGVNNGDNVYYINVVSRENAMQLSSNGGTSYSNLNYTIDSHIHQISVNPLESFTYQICAKDMANNSACSSFYTDYVDVPNTAPSLITIYNPLENGTYHTSLLINHSFAFSPTNQKISNYTYEYVRSGYTSYTFIGLNDNNTNTFLWDISNLLNDLYILRITTTDNLGLYSYTYREFNISSLSGYDTALLSQILTELQNSNDISEETKGGIQMLWFIIALLISIMLPFIIAKLSPKDKELSVFLSVILFGFLMFMNVSVNYFNFDEFTQGFITFLLLALIIIFPIYLLENNVITT